MSFIVDATRRQEEYAVPEQAASWAYERVRRRERRIWLVIGALTALALGLAAILVMRWYFPERGRTEAPVPAVVPDTAAPSPSTAVPIVASEPGVPYYQPIESEPEPVAAPRTPLALRDAPQDAQQALLNFNYSSHLYSTHPPGRSLTVDGRRLREGDVVDEWALAEITETGAIWDNGDVMVIVPVLDLWK